MVKGMGMDDKARINARFELCGRYLSEHLHTKKQNKMCLIDVSV